MQGKMRCVASLFDPFLATTPFQYSLKSICFLIFPGSVEKVCWREINSITTSYEIKILKKVKTDWVFQTWLLEKFHGINTIVEKLLLTKNIAIQICILYIGYLSNQLLVYCYDRNHYCLFENLSLKPVYPSLTGTHIY